MGKTTAYCVESIVYQTEGGAENSNDIRIFESEADARELYEALAEDLADDYIRERHANRLATERETYAIRLSMMIGYDAETQDSDDYEVMDVAEYNVEDYRRDMAITQAEEERDQKWEEALTLAGIGKYHQTCHMMLETIAPALDLADVDEMDAEQLAVVVKAAKLAYDKGLADGKRGE